MLDSKYKDLDYRFAERAVCMEKFNIKNPGKKKFHIPSLMPMIEGGKPKEKPIKVSKSHLINKDKGAINSSGMMNTKNYIEIELPNYITAPIRDFDIEIKMEYDGCEAPEGGGKAQPGKLDYEVKKKIYYFYEVDDSDMVEEGKEFIVEFIGGDINQPKIVERYN